MVFGSVFSVGKPEKLMLEGSFTTHNIWHYIYNFKNEKVIDWGQTPQLFMDSHYVIFF